MERYKILVVDSDTAMVSLISDILLETQMYDITPAYDGIIVLETMESALPDLIIMDFNLPGLDGIKVAKLLKSNLQTKSVPIIITNGVDDSQLIEQAFHAGASDFIQKPFTNMELQIRVENILKTNRLTNETITSARNDLSLMALQNSQYMALKSKYKDILENIMSQCPNRQANCGKALEKFIIDLRTDLPCNSKQQLESLQKIDPLFMKALAIKHPNLTPAEIKLCIYLKLNLSTKDIAALIFQNSNSVRIARVRLRKKLNLNMSDNLTGYINSL
jgi:DNA-binding response OmpR family regulator/DNA-binding CsgD family transcriptional regulator